MRKIAKVGVAVVGVPIIALLLFLTYYDLHDFRPYLSRINAIYDAMNAEDRQPPPAVEDFISKVQGQKGDYFAASSLLWEIRGLPAPKLSYDASGADASHQKETPQCIRRCPLISW